MPVLQHFRQRLVLLSRVIMWAALALLVMVGIFRAVPAWAEPTTCTGNSTSGNASIPVTAQVIYLIYGGPPSTYEISLCGDPEPGDEVDFTTAISPPPRITVSPSTFTLDDTTPQEVSVSIRPNHNRRVPFTSRIRHFSDSSNPGFDNQTITLTAYYSPPVALIDLAVVRLGTSIELDVLANDTDRLGQGLFLDSDAIVVNATRGSATVNDADDTIEYDAPNNGPGAARFTYRVDDAIGNTDTAQVVVVLFPRNLFSVVSFLIGALTGGDVIFPSAGGEIEVDIPPLTGVSPDAEVACIIGDATTTSGDLTDKPYDFSMYTGLSFYLDCYADGEPVTQAMLTGPISVLVPLSEEFSATYGKTNLQIANWSNEDWQTADTTLVTVDEEALTVETTRLGEFAVFSQGIVRFPFLLKAEDAE